MTTNLPVNLDDLLQGLAKEATSVERPSVSTIGTRAGQLTYNKVAVPNNKMDAIIIASTHSNMYYTESFDPDAPVNPTCYAYSATGTDMKPHPSVATPQHDNCAECPHNKWGSAEKGRGKACKNTRVLALVPADVKPEEVPVCELAVLKLPVTSVENFSNYVNKVAVLYKRPPLGVVTTISTKPHPKHQFHVEFDQAGIVAPELLQGLIERRDSALATLEREYSPNEPNEEKAAPTKPNNKLG